MLISSERPWAITLENSKRHIQMKRNLATLCLVACVAFSSPAARAQSASDATEAVREAISDLLDDFDGFKDSEIFRRCVYGCGSENPGNEWRDRSKRSSGRPCGVRRSRPGSKMPSANCGRWAEPTPEAMPAKQLNCASASRLCWKSKIATTNQANSRNRSRHIFPHRRPQPEKRPYRHPQRNYLASRLI